jgi:hypothetical protein
MSRVALKKQYGHCAMSKDQDPDHWLAELTYLHSRIDAIPNSVPMSNEDMIAHILGNLTSDYSKGIMSIEHELDTPNNSTITTSTGTNADLTSAPLTLDRIQRRM